MESTVRCCYDRSIPPSVAFGERISFMNLHLKDHVVVVTGGVGGIGKAVVEGFLEEGARVAVWDLSVDTESLPAEYQEAALGCVVDITDERSIDSALQKCRSQLGPIDHLVHCAAIGSGKFGFPFTNLQPEDWKRVLDVNIMGMVNVAHAVTPEMCERNQGTMIFISSIAGQIGSPTDPPYSASKAANINFAQCMAKDLAACGVRVNSICPGMVKSDLNRGVWKAWYDQQPPENRRSYEDWAAQKIRDVVPLGQWQRPQDVADMALFLSSERAAHVTGQTMNVDGGIVMHS